MQTTEDVKKKFPDEWVLAEVIEENEIDEPTKVKVIKHSRCREDVYEALKDVKTGAHVTTFFTGELPKKGYAVAF